MIGSSFHYNGGLIRANACPFMEGDGTQTQAGLVDTRGRPLTTDKLLRVNAVHRTDWQGRVQLLDAPRSNFLISSGEWYDPASPLYGSFNSLYLSATQGRLTPSGEYSSVIQAVPTYRCTVGLSSTQIADTYGSATRRYFTVGIAKNSGSLGFPGFGAQFDGSTVTRFSVMLNLATGDTIRCPTPLDGNVGWSVVDAGDFWWIKFWFDRLAASTGVRMFVWATLGTSWGVSSSSFVGDSVEVFGFQCTDHEGIYIPTSNGPMTQTDYTLSGTNVVLASAPVTGAIMDWDGVSYR